MKLLNKWLTGLIDRLFNRNIIIKDVCVIKYGEPTRNGYVYSKGCIDLEDLNAKIKNGLLLGKLDSGDDRLDNVMSNLCQASHVIIGADDSDESLKLCVKTLKTDNGRLLKDLMKLQPLTFTPCCLGKVGSNGEIFSAKIVSINARPMIKQ